MKFKELLITEAIQYNIENNKSLCECAFRRESKMFYQYFSYLRENKDKFDFDEFGKEIINGNLGTFGLYEGIEVPLDLPFIEKEDTLIEKSEEKVELNKPKRGGPKKFYVYVKNDKGNIIKVSFGDPDLSVKFNDEEARKSFAARHDCKNKKDRTTPGYWSCNLPRYASQLGLSDGGNFYW